MKAIKITIVDRDNNNKVIAESNNLVNDKDVNHIVDLVINTLNSFKSGRPDLYKSQKRKEVVDDKINKLW